MGKLVHKYMVVDERRALTMINILDPSPIASLEWMLDISMTGTGRW